MRLNTAPPEQALTLKTIEGGMELRRRLSELGLTTGVRMEVIRTTGSGPILIRVSESKIAIGRGIAAHIEVEPIS